MNRSEFLNQLREALDNDLDASAVQDNINYYSNYIAEEIHNGRSEAEVLGMLGDPWVIARNIIDSPAGRQRYGSSYTYEPDSRGEHEQQKDQQPYYHFGINTWWKKLLLALITVGIIIIVFAVITGLLSLLLPIIVPLLIIIFIVRLLTQ